MHVLLRRQDAVLSLHQAVIIASKRRQGPFMDEKIECFICGDTALSAVHSRGGFKPVHCPSCKEYEITRSAIEVWGADVPGQRERVAAALRQQFDEQHWQGVHVPKLVSPL